MYFFNRSCDEMFCPGYRRSGWVIGRATNTTFFSRIIRLDVIVWYTGFYTDLISILTARQVSAPDDACHLWTIDCIVVSIQIKQSSWAITFPIFVIAVRPWEFPHYPLFSWAYLRVAKTLLCTMFPTGMISHPLQTPIVLVVPVLLYECLAICDPEICCQNPHHRFPFMGDEL